jgi:hypothetical protein
MFFGGFLRQSNYDQKKGTVVWPTVGMFRGSMSLDCCGGFLDQITTQKKGTVVWPSVAMTDYFGGFDTMFFGRFLDQITNYDRKKGTVGTPTPVSLTPFATHVTFYFYYYYVCSILY